jgi:hypothetical protein
VGKLEWECASALRLYGRGWRRGGGSRILTDAISDVSRFFLERETTNHRIQNHGYRESVSFFFRVFGTAWP